MKTAFPQTQNPVSIRLYSNIPFDNTYQNHSLISDRFTYHGTLLYEGNYLNGSPCERFINRKVGQDESVFYYPHYDTTDTFNFDFQNGLIGSVVMELTPEKTNANYMRVTCGNDVYYYFITGIKQINFQTYSLSLELDVLMTYQDEFLDGIKDMPVMTSRKHSHRYTNDGKVPHCADYKSGDSTFANIKPSIISKIEQMGFYDAEMKKLSPIKWLYVCIDMSIEENSQHYPFTFKGIKMPLGMLCMPLCKKLTFIDDEDHTLVITEDKIKKFVEKLVGDGKVHATKVSNFPPFVSEHILVTEPEDGEFVIRVISSSENMVIDGGAILWDNNKTRLCGFFSDDPTYEEVYFNSLNIVDEYNGDYDLDNINLGFKRSTKPSITSPRVQDPKILFAPFKKYTISATYGQPYEFFPELAFSDHVYQVELPSFGFGAVFTSYIGDYNHFTYLKPLLDDNDYYAFAGYKINNIGLSCNVNHVVPAGTNALDLFNSTQAQSFYQSKTATGITSGVSIAGGIASMIIGAGMTAGSAGSLTPAGAMLVTSGAMAISGGLAGGVNAIKSSTAKIEDLKNTPDSINVQGGALTSDYARGELMPFIAVYDVTENIKEMANDYFYNYGYEVSRECYFNTEMYYDNNNSFETDNNLFGRTIFNYIKITEDITNKINANIPLIVKQKLSQVFNNGITIWNFFGFNDIWSLQVTPSEGYEEDKWFMKHTYDNTELSLMLP